MSDNRRGALYMLLAMLFYVSNDAVSKTFADTLPVAQLIALRGLGATALLGAAMLVLGVRAGGFSRADAGRIAVRTLCEGAAAFLFINAIYLIPLANAITLEQTLPLLLTLAAMLFLGEKVGWRRLSAIAAGMVGVLIMLRPSAGGFGPGSLLVLAAVLMMVGRELFTRGLSPAVPSLAVSFYTSLGVALLGLAGTGHSGWVGLDPWGWAKLAATVLFIALGYVFSIMTVRVGALSAVNTFRYSSIVFAVILGWLIWGDFPDALTLAGAAIVAGAGAFTLWREGPRPRAAAVPPSPEGLG